MMMRICREKSKSPNSSLITLPPSLHHDLSHSFHQTPCLPYRCGPPPPPPDFCPPPLRSPFQPPAAEGSSSYGYAVDLRLMSCTESLGFESSDEISSLDFGSNCSTSSNADQDSPSFSSSSPFSSSFSSFTSSPMKKWPENRSAPEKKEFPPPLTTMSRNGRRSFVLRPERKDGRLQIVKVEIERPEFLYASRKDGRLTLRFARSVPQYEEDEDDVEGEEEERETLSDSEEEEEEEKEEERESTAAAAEKGEKEEEETEWKFPAAGRRRCYQYNIPVWGQQQRRWVATIM